MWSNEYSLGSVHPLGSLCRCRLSPLGNHKKDAVVSLKGLGGKGAYRKDGERPLTGECSDRTRGNGLKLN